MLAEFLVLLSTATFNFHGGNAYVGARVNWFSGSRQEAIVECPNVDLPCLVRNPTVQETGDEFTLSNVIILGKNRYEKYTLDIPAHINDHDVVIFPTEFFTNRGRFNIQLKSYSLPAQ